MKILRRIHIIRMFFVLIIILILRIVAITKINEYENKRQVFIQVEEYSTNEILQNLDKDNTKIDIPVTNNDQKETEIRLQDNELEKVNFVRTVDGDTVIVNDGFEDIRIRFLCVNTPESVSNDKSKNNKFGELASTFTKEYFKNIKHVYLQYDIEQEDPYGRTLAYVWLSNNVDIKSESDIRQFMYNAILLEEGMCDVVIYEPNKLYKKLFYTIEEEATDSNIGLWEYDEFRILVK